MTKEEQINIVRLLSGGEENYNLGRNIVKGFNSVSKKKDRINTKELLESIGLISMRKQYLEKDGNYKRKKTRTHNYILRFEGGRKLRIRKKYTTVYSNGKYHRFRVFFSGDIIEDGKRKWISKEITKDPFTENTENLPSLWRLISKTLKKHPVLETIS